MLLRLSGSQRHHAASGSEPVAAIIAAISSRLMFAPAAFSPSGGCHIKREAFVSVSVYSLDDGIAARQEAASLRHMCLSTT